MTDEEQDDAIGRLIAITARLVARVDTMIEMMAKLIELEEARRRRQ